MRNPVNRLATAAPRALDSLLAGNKQQKHQSHDGEAHEKKQERSWSFDFDFIDKINGGVGMGMGSSGVGSVGEEGSVVTFEDLSSEFTSSPDLLSSSGKLSGEPLGVEVMSSEYDWSDELNKVQLLMGGGSTTAAATAIDASGTSATAAASSGASNSTGW